MRWFSAIDVKGDPDCLVALKSLHQLQRLYLESCGDTVDGVVHLANHFSLREVQIENAKISRTVIEALQSIPNLRVLVFDNIEFDPKDWMRLADLCKRCAVTFGEIRGLEKNDLESLISLNDELRRQRDQVKKREKGAEPTKADEPKKPVRPLKRE